MRERLVTERESEMEGDGGRKVGRGAGFERKEGREREGS